MSNLSFCTMMKPAVVAARHFDAEKDSQSLRDAMKGLGTDEEPIMEILCARSYDQITEIRTKYQQMFGRVLVDDLKSELGGKLEKVMLALTKSPIQQNAHTIRHAVKGLGTDETAIIEVMCTSTNEELKEIKEVYKKEFGHDLEKDLAGDTSGDFKRLLRSMCMADRDENGPEIDDAEACTLAQKLYDAGEAGSGTDEEAFNVVFGRRGFHQLRRVFEIYKTNHSDEKGIMGAIDSEFSGSLKEAYKALATVAMDGREAYFADQLYRSMKGLGTNDNQLIRIMTSRSQVDLKGIEIQFLRRYGKTLEDFINEDTTGDYRACLMKLAKGNHH